MDCVAPTLRCLGPVDDGLDETPACILAVARHTSTIRDAGGEATFIRCDVSKEEEVEAAVEACVRIHGRLDCAFSNAGVGPDDKRVPVLNVVDRTEEVWDRTLDVNLEGAFLCMKHEMRQMMKQEGGGR